MGILWMVSACNNILVYLRQLKGGRLLLKRLKLIKKLLVKINKNLISTEPDFGPYVLTCFSARFKFNEISALQTTSLLASNITTHNLFKIMTRIIKAKVPTTTCFYARIKTCGIMLVKKI